MSIPVFLVDEAPIVAQHDAWIGTDSELQDHLALTNGILDFIDRALRVEPHASTEHLMQLRLSVRCFNSIAASLRLIRCGYWQPAFTTIRDLLETHFLLDLLTTDAAASAQWHQLPDKERKKVFSPLQVRTKLDDRDGFTERKRQKAYEDLSRYAAHPTPEGFTLISPADMTQIGPFPDKKLLRAALQELVKRAGNTSVLVGGVVKTQDRPFLLFKAGFYGHLQQWMDTYMKPAEAKVGVARPKKLALPLERFCVRINPRRDLRAQATAITSASANALSSSIINGRSAATSILVIVSPSSLAVIEESNHTVRCASLRI